ncbi:MAG: tyrosine recombinase XerD [Acidimicrobiia bacterium]|nr:tyrosine recombinase XerD [Acidimicrobiia bacterium]
MPRATPPHPVRTGNADDPPAALPPHAVDFLGSLSSERGLAANTTRAYRRDLVRYANTLEDLGSPSTTVTVREHIRRLRSSGLAPSTIARNFASLRSYHRFLVVEGFRDDDPTVGIDAPTRTRSLPKALTVDQVLTLLEAPDGTASGVRDRAVLEFLYATGCRVSEVTAVDLHDVDIETRTALLTGKGSKQRMVPIGSYAVSAIESWLPVRMRVRVSGHDDGALFLSSRGNRLSRQAVWRIVRVHGRAAGIPDADLSPHVLRHSAATHMVEGGADLRTVQELLGHASLSTTQVYTKVSPEHLAETVRMSHPRAG